LILGPEGQRSKSHGSAMSECLFISTSLHHYTLLTFTSQGNYYAADSVL